MNNYREKTEETFKRMTHGQQTTYGTIQRIVENNLQKSLEEKVKESMQCTFEESVVSHSTKVVGYIQAMMTCSIGYWLPHMISLQLGGKLVEELGLLCMWLHSKELQLLLYKFITAHS